MIQRILPRPRVLVFAALLAAVPAISPAARAQSDPTVRQADELASLLYPSPRLYSSRTYSYAASGRTVVPRSERRNPASIIHPLSPIAVETAIPDSLLNPPRHDPWFAFDKVQHFTFSFLFTVGSQYALVNKANVSESRALPVSIGVSSVIGLSKELYDYHVGPTRYFSKRDLVVDALGVAFAAGFILL